MLGERVEATGLRFDPNVGPHDHFICVACGRILDLPDRDGARRGRAALSRGEHVRTAARMGLEILDRSVELYGRCRDYRRRGGPVRGGSLGDSRSLASRAVRASAVRAFIPGSKEA